MSGLRRWWAARWDGALERMDEQERRRTRRLPGWRTRRRRRMVASLCAVGLASMIAGTLTMFLEDDVPFLVLWFGGYVLWFVTIFLLRTLTGKMSTAFSTLLDERERQWRHRVNQVGYHALVYLMALSFVYMVIIGGQPDAAVRGAMFMASMLGVGISLPTLLLGWLIPDDDPEDFSDPDLRRMSNNA